jgi:hypothetical protein
MFQIDTGNSGGGSAGPWMAWSSNGSAMKEIKAMSWVLRGKDEGGKFERNIPAFEAGAIIDLDTLKLGWEREGLDRPERRWNPTLAQAMPRPSEEKKATGGYVWTNALSVRVALGKGEVATWEQGQWAAYEGFARLAKQINAQIGANKGKLPMIKQTGVEKIKLGNGTANIPLLEIVKWVDRPDSLAADAPQISIAPSAPPAPPPPPSVDLDDAEF